MGTPYGFRRHTAEIQLHQMLLHGAQVFPVFGRQGHMREHLRFFRTVMQIADIESFHNHPCVIGAAGVPAVAEKYETVFATGVKSEGQIIHGE